MTISDNEQLRLSSMDQHYTELAEIAGGFIHEIKNHLSTLGLNLQLLGEDFQNPQTPRERRALTRVQRLQAQCQHLVEVSNDFLRFARVKDLNLVPTDLSKIVDEMIDFFAPTAHVANIDLKAFVPVDLPPVLLDQDLFKQALLNLMLNAEQAMENGGQLTIEAISVADCKQNPEADGIASAVSGFPSAICKLQSAIELCLIDTGKGMTAEVRKRIFEPFFSTKQGGSGLGLATTRRIIEAHGGSIAVESEPGRGSKFTIRLPVVTKARPVSAVIEAD